MPGDTAYVRNWPDGHSVLILNQCNTRWPHYIVVDATGNEWRISQLELSRKPILWR